MDKKHILSLDGGGVITLASITFLKLLEKETGIKIHEKFDFFVGTSAGAISCLALAVKRFSSRELEGCLLYTSPSPRDATLSRMPSSA